MSYDDIEITEVGGDIEITEVGGDIEIVEVGTVVTGGVNATNLAIGTKTATTLIVTSDTGADATIPAASATEAGLLSASDKSKIDTALQPASNLDATKLTGTVPIESIPASVATAAEVTAAVAAHLATVDPHPQYLTPAEANAAYAPISNTGSTNLSIANRTATTIDIASDTGQDATIPGASTTLSGVMSAADKAKLDGITAGAQPNAVISVAGKTGVITLVKADVGLGLADNTADADKPISTATATALAARESTAARTLTPTATDPGNTATINGFLSWLISAMRGAQTTLSGLGALANKSTIANIDVAAGAAIAWSKISKSGAVAADVGAQPAAVKLTTIAALTGTTPIRSDGSNGALTAAEIPNLDASKTTTGTFLDSQIPASIARDSEVTAAIAAHSALADPHPTYLTAAEGNAAYAPLGATGTTNLTVTNRTATTIDIASDTGTDATIPAATTALSGVMGAADKAKLDGIAAGAQVNTVTSVAGKTGVVTLVKGDVGLGLVDNTTDANKPISTATATALAARELTAARTLTPTATDPGNTATINGFLSWLISAMRTAQTTLSGLGTLATKSTIVSADITDGTITNADISPSAGIAASKLSGVQPLTSRLTGFQGLTAAGLPILPAGADSVPTIATPAEIRTAAGLANAFGLPGFTYQFPLAMVPLANREGIDASGSWVDLSYVSYDFESKLKSYLGTTAPMSWKLLIVGTNEIANQDLYAGTEPWWIPAYDPVRGKIEARMFRPFFTGTQYAPIRLSEYWGVGSAAANYLIVDIPTMPSGVGMAIFYDDYWLIQIRATQSNPSLSPKPKWSVYAITLLGVMQ